ncbi:MAG: hypothetical protein VKK62_08580 [Synechococcaceae cyanobacterium]|nr:hypothetical protein [Synechococcaceae cyanobacterium]
MIRSAPCSTPLPARLLVLLATLVPPGAALALPAGSLSQASGENTTVIQSGTSESFGITNSDALGSKPPRLVCSAILKTTPLSPSGLLVVSLTNTGGGPAPAGGQHRWSVLALRASGVIPLTAPLAIGQSVSSGTAITKPVPTPAPPYACGVSAVVPGAAF